MNSSSRKWIVFYLFARAGTKKRDSGANADGIITIKIEQS